jgi:hypothetical protein
MQISRSKVSRFLRALAVEDAGISCKLALSKLTHPLFNMYHVFDFNLASVYQLPATQFPLGVTLRLFRGEGDVTCVAAMLALAGMSLKTVEHRMRRGDLAALVFANDEELAAYSWTTFIEAWIAEIRATLPLRSDEAVRYDSLVMPRWRGKGLNYPLSLPISPYLFEHGYRRTLSWVSALNTRSVRTQFRQGKRKIATIVSSPLLGLVHLRNLSPAVGITLERRIPRGMTG